MKCALQAPETSDGYFLLLGTKNVSTPLGFQGALARALKFMAVCGKVGAALGHAELCDSKRTIDVPGLNPRNVLSQSSLTLRWALRTKGLTGIERTLDASNCFKPPCNCRANKMTIAQCLYRKGLKRETTEAAAYLPHKLASAARRLSVLLPEHDVTATLVTVMAHLDLGPDILASYVSYCKESPAPH
eukprot:1158637-Pelagomonas_calceolata.AAC.3